MLFTVVSIRICSCYKLREIFVYIYLFIHIYYVQYALLLQNLDNIVFILNKKHIYIFQKKTLYGKSH